MDTASSPRATGPTAVIRRLYLGFVVSVTLVAPAFAELAMTGAPVAMRTRPAGKARIVQHIPRTAEIDVVRCARGWCRASWRGRFGYVPADAVVFGPSPGDAATPLANAPPTEATRPAWRWQGFYLGGSFGFPPGAW